MVQNIHVVNRLNMSTAVQCPDCGASLLAEARRGVCPACFIRRALTPSPDEGEDWSDRLQSQAEDDKIASDTQSDFNDYELLEEIGQGGMGVIFKARQRNLDRLVALKLIRSGSLAKPADIARFRTEAAAAGQLQHPHIVAIYEIGENQGRHFYSMEYVPGQSLAHALRHGPFSPRQAATLLLDVAGAIQFAHQSGVLHRDLKPSNILLDAQGSPRVADFGLAKLLKSDSELTVSGAVIGSPQYMSPEQARGRSAKADTRSDVYSLGAILYELLTGHPPFSAATALETLKLVVEREPVAPRILNPALPRDLETICLKCLAKEASSRYSSAQDFADELSRFLRGEPIRARPVTPVERAWRWCRRKPALSSMAAAVVFATLAGFVAVAWQWRKAKANEIAARSQAAKSQQVILFLQQTLNGAGLSIVEGRDKTLPRAILNQTAARVAAELKDQPDARAEVCSALGEVHQALGEYIEAEKMQREALGFYRQIFGPEHAKIALSLRNLAMALYGQGQLTAAESYLQEAVAMDRRLFGEDSLPVAASLYDLASVLRAKGELAEAEQADRQALTVRRKLPVNEGLELIASLGNLALVLQGRDKPDEAEVLLREALGDLREFCGNDPAREVPTLGLVLQRLAALLINRKALPEARSLAAEAVVLYRRHSDWPARDHQHALRVLGGVLAELNDSPGLDAVYEESLAFSRQPRENDDPTAITPLRSLARILRKAGKPAEARNLSNEAVARYARLAERGDVGAMGGAAWLLATCPDSEVRDGPRAVLFAQQAIAATQGRDANLLDTLAAAYAAAGEFAKAVSAQEKAIALMRDEATKNAFSQRLKLYQANQPYVD